MAKKKSHKQRAAQNATKNGSRNPAKVQTSISKTENGADEELQNKMATKGVAPVINMTISSTVSPPKGLVNLGNTCFFNSVMQNLCRTPGLLYAMQQTAKKVDLEVESENVPNINCELPSSYKLSQALLNFLVTMRENSMDVSNNVGRQKVRTRTESPKALFNQISSVSPRFRGYQQQDSQELFQALLDGIKTEEVKRRKQAILSKLGLLRKKASDINDQLKAQVKSYGEIVSKMPTVVDLVFGGELVSSVLCDECGQITQVIEQFLDIPLPIVEIVPSHPHVGGVGRKGNKKATDKEEVAMDKNPSTCEKADIQMALQSKHAKKKQRHQNRRKSKRNRTKSQNLDGEQEEHTNEQVQDRENTDQKSEDSVGDVEEAIPSTAAECMESCVRQGNGIDGDSQAEDLHGGGDFHNVTKEDQNDNVVKAESSAMESMNYRGTEGVADGSVENAIQVDIAATRNGEATLKTSGDVSGLCSQMQGLVMTEHCKGTDFFMIRESINTDFQVESNKSESLTRKIVKNADRVVQLVLTDATRELQQRFAFENEQISKCDVETISEKSPEHSSLEPECKNNCLLGGEVPSETTSLECNVSENKSDNCPARASLSSGNDEKSEDESCRHSQAHHSGPSLFETPAKSVGMKFTSFCSKLPRSLSPRYEPKSQECSIQSCLHKFTMAEMLTGNNQFGCDECTKRHSKATEKPKTVYCNASKQLLIKKPPIILTLQLKRFQQTGRSLRKFSKRVEVPVELDLSPFCTQHCRDYADDGKILYALYGVVEHSGSLSRGHYTAYVSTRPENPKILRYLGKEIEERASDVENLHGQWYHISDTSVSKCTQERVLNSNAYLLFYERIF